MDKPPVYDKHIAAFEAIIMTQFSENLSLTVRLSTEQQLCEECKTLLEECKTEIETLQLELDEVKLQNIKLRNRL